MLNFEVQYLDSGLPELVLPRSEDVGIDVYSRLDLEIPIQTSKLVPTGVCIQSPKGYWLQVQDRSSVSKYCHTLAGIIDQGYCGEILINMYCHLNRDGEIEHKSTSSPLFGYSVDKRCYRVKRGDKIAQLIIRRNYNGEAQFTKVNRLTPTERGNGGFGSTGK